MIELILTDMRVMIAGGFKLPEKAQELEILTILRGLSIAV
jgi:hypothetical protein